MCQYHDSHYHDHYWYLSDPNRDVHKIVVFKIVVFILVLFILVLLCIVRTRWLSVLVTARFVTFRFQWTIVQSFLSPLYSRFHSRFTVVFMVNSRFLCCWIGELERSSFGDDRCREEGSMVMFCIYAYHYCHGYDSMIHSTL